MSDVRVQIQASSTEKTFLLLLSKSSYAWKKFCFSVRFLPFFRGFFFSFSLFGLIRWLPQICRIFTNLTPLKSMNQVSLSNNRKDHFLGVVWLGLLLHKYLPCIYFLLSIYIILFTKGRTRAIDRSLTATSGVWHSRESKFDFKNIMENILVNLTFGLKGICCAPEYYKGLDTHVL